MTFWKWSQTAANNGTADSSCPFPEGMSPSAVNDGTRGMMAAAAKYRDDIAGAILTTGTSTAYAVSSYEVYDTLAHLDKMMIAFTPHTTCGATVTLNVDGLGARPLRSAPGVEIAAGTLIQGTPYVATYSNTDGAFYLHSFYGNPYNIPLGGMMPYLGTTAPNSSFVLPYGQPISRTTYAALFSLVGTTFGAGDGTTTFNIIDLRGRIPVPQDNMGGAAAGRITTAGSGVDGTTIGANGGSQNKALQRSDLPNVSISPTITDPGHAHTYNIPNFVVNGAGGSGGPPYVNTTTGATTNTATTGISAQFYLNGNVTQTLVNGMPPSIIVPWILRVI
jgi:microcystin-dependent protein